MKDFTITKREILVSIIIICVMLTLGFIIGDIIHDAEMEKQQEYNTAVEIDNNSSLFQYGMRTNIGKAFVYGTIKTVDPVTYPEIGGEYSYVKKVKERYTQHTRVVTKTRVVDGKTQSYITTETYWSWDAIDREEKSATKITFLDTKFDYGTIELPFSEHIDTIKESSHIRYVYYGAPTESTGTLYATLGDNTISEVEFYRNSTITETKERLTSGAGTVVFWVLWILVTGGLVFGFYYIDNKWLED
jgi:hypothetical protein